MIRKEGADIQHGINYTETKFGHSLLIKISTFVFGYYWGNKFAFKGFTL